MREGGKYIRGDRDQGDESAGDQRRMEIVWIYLIEGG